MKLEIYYKYKSDFGATLHTPVKMIRPLDNKDLFRHCAQEGGETTYLEWSYYLEELLKIHGVKQFSYVDKTKD